MSSTNRVNISFSLSPDEKTATIKMSNRRSPIVTGCLAVERDNNGHIIKAYLDSLIHFDSKSTEYEGFALSGAISTIVTRVSNG